MPTNDTKNCESANYVRFLKCADWEWSFATLMLSKGISVESIAKMLGHSELKTTMIYAKILEKKVIEEVRFAEDSLKELTDVFKGQMSKKKKE